MVITSFDAVVGLPHPIERSPSGIRGRPIYAPAVASMHEDDLVFGCELGERTAGADQHGVGDEPAVFVVWLDLVNLRRQLEGVDRRVLGGEEREEITLYPSVALAHECFFLSHMIANITLTTSRSASNQSARGFDLLPERQTFLGVDGLPLAVDDPLPVVGR